MFLKLFLKIIFVYVVALFCCFCFLLDRRYLNNLQLQFFNSEISKDFLNITCNEPPKEADVIIPIFHHDKLGAQGPLLALPHAQQSLFMLRTSLRTVGSAPWEHRGELAMDSGQLRDFVGS